MYGDFSRNPFSQPNTTLETREDADGDQGKQHYQPKVHVTRVLFNQGQPLVEADLNEALSAAVENARHVGGFELTGSYCNDSESLTLYTGSIRSPVGGFEIKCPIRIALSETPSDYIAIEISEHPLSLAYLSQRLADERLVHASEIWGMRIRAVSDGRMSSQIPQTKCQVSCDSQSAARLPKHSIIRIEVHSISTDGKYVFKLDTHNAGYANTVCKISNGSVTLDRNSCFVRPIRENELIEIQEPTSDSFIAYSDDCNRSLHTIKNITDRTVTLLDSPPIPNWKRGLQCRFWSESAHLDANKPTEISILFARSGIKVEFAAFPDEVKPGMAWLVDSDDLISAATRKPTPKSVCAFSIYPEAVYSFGIKLIPCAQAAPALGALEFHPAISQPSGQLVAQHLAPPLNWHDLPCGALAVEADSSAMRRWLASMTLGELAGLDHEQVRARLTRDCNIRLEADPNLESEISKLIARRDHYLGSSYSQPA